MDKTFIVTDPATGQTLLVRKEGDCYRIIGGEKFQKDFIETVNEVAEYYKGVAESYEKMIKKSPTN